MQACYEKKRPCPITSSRSADDPVSHLSNGDAASLKCLIALRWRIGLTELPVVCSFSWTVLHCAWPSGCLGVNKEYQWSYDNWNGDLNTLIIPSTRHIYQPDSASYFFPSYYSCLDADVTLCSDDSEQAEPPSSELTALVWKLWHPIGPQLEDNLHVPSMPAEEQNSNQTSPQMQAECFWAGCLWYSTLRGNLGSCRQGIHPGDTAGPSQQLLHGALCAEYIFFRQINQMAKIPSWVHYF